MASKYVDEELYLPFDHRNMVDMGVLAVTVNSLRTFHGLASGLQFCRVEGCNYNPGQKSWDTFAKTPQIVFLLGGVPRNFWPGLYMQVPN